MLPYRQYLHHSSSCQSSMPNSVVHSDRFFFDRRDHAGLVPIRELPGAGWPSSSATSPSSAARNGSSGWCATPAPIWPAPDDRVQHAGGDLRRRRRARRPAARRSRPGVPRVVEARDREALRARRADLAPSARCAPPRRPRRRRRTPRPRAPRRAPCRRARCTRSPPSRRCRSAASSARVALAQQRVLHRRGGRREPAARAARRAGCPSSVAVARHQRDDASSPRPPAGAPATRTWPRPSSGSGRSGGCRR